MSDIKNILQNKVVSPSIETSTTSKTLGVVIRAYEKDNVCDVRYSDIKSRIVTKEKVEVMPKNMEDDWFPSSGTLVVVETYGNSVFITGQVIKDYSKEVRPYKKLQHDIYVDGGDATVGNYIF